MAAPITKLTSFICAALFAFACSDASSDKPRAEPSTMPDAGVEADARAPADAAAIERAPASSLSHLPAGNHLGMTPAYETLPDQTAAAFAQRQTQVVEAGLDVARVHVSWAELEPRPGEFDLSSLEDELARAPSASTALLVLVETLDSEGYALPADLVDPADRYRLAQGRALSDPPILARYDALIDQLAPTLAAKKIFAFAVANEPDAYLDDVEPSSAEAQAWVQALSAFTKHARQKIQAKLPDVAVGMTLRQGGLEKGLDLSSVIASGDVAIFNYYCQDAALLVDDVSRVDVEVDQMLSAAVDLPIVLQELGCPAGPEGAPSLIGASPQKQSDFFAAVAARMKSEPRMRAAFVFTAVDWSPALAKQLADPYRAEGLPDLAARYEETLGTCGLLRYEDGMARPSWNAFAGGVSDLRAQ